MEDLYKSSETFGEVVKYTGLDYKHIIMKKTLSPYLFNNVKVGNFLNYLNDIMYNLIESVKYIKTFTNYTIDKDYKKIR